MPDEPFAETLDGDVEEMEVDADTDCKGTVGSEAGDLSEPAVRRKSHKLETI